MSKKRSPAQLAAVAAATAARHNRSPLSPSRIVNDLGTCLPFPRPDPVPFPKLIPKTRVSRAVTHASLTADLDTSATALSVAQERINRLEAQLLTQTIDAETLTALHNAQSAHVAVLEAQLSTGQVAVQQAQETLAECQASLANAGKKADMYRKRFRAERRRNQRTQTSVNRKDRHLINMQRDINRLDLDLHHSKALTLSLSSECDAAVEAYAAACYDASSWQAEATRVQCMLDAANREVDYLATSLEASNRQLYLSRQKSRALQMRSSRAPTVTSNALKRAGLRKIKSKGLYSSEIRCLARILRKAGTAKRHIGTVIMNFAQTLGLKVEKCMSPRTVGRAELEGLVASKVQLGYEISQATSKSKPFADRI